MEKLIGVFTEVDGLETEKIGEMMDKLGIVGSISGNIDNIGLYCDNKGITYVIVHNSEKHFTSFTNKDEEEKYRFFSNLRNEFDKDSDTITNKMNSLLFGKNNDNDTYIVSDDTDGVISRVHIYKHNVHTVPDELKKKIIKSFGYEIYGLIE